MIVGVIQHWKIPVGYFSVNGLSGEERVNLVMQCLMKLYDVGVNVVCSHQKAGRENRRELLRFQPETGFFLFLLLQSQIVSLEAERADRRRAPHMPSAVEPLPSSAASTCEFTDAP